MSDSIPFQDAVEKLEFHRLKNRVSSFALTSLGRERILDLAPSIMFAEIRDELERVREMTGLLEHDDTPPLETVDDVRDILHRASIEGSVTPAEDFLRILRLLIVSRKLHAFFDKRKSRIPLLAHIATDLYADKMLEFHVDRVVDEEGEVKDSASKELRSLRREIIEQSGQLRRRMEQILKRVSEEQAVMEELVTMRDGRMVLPVKAEYKRQVSGFIHSSSASGQTVFIEPTETLELNNDIRDLQFAEQREINSILTELTDRLRSNVQPLLATVSAISEIDSLYARARYAIEYLATTPTVNRDGILSLQEARHPLLLTDRKRRDIVALDIDIGGENRTIIITGPNAGGKSVAMKTLGLLAIMLQSGIPVPCDEESEFPVYSNVFVDIGDEQSLENHLSTFSSHVQRLANIVDAADEHSLVLIDEIGTGTDPSEGSALGAAILEELTRRQSHVIATTHHGMLKAFAHAQPGMMNAAMEFDLHTLEPTYRFRAGLPGSSYAFEITRRHGMDEKIIDRARAILGTQSDALEKLLSEVERQSQELGVHLRKSEQLEEKYRGLSADYEEKMKKAKNESKQLKKNALEEAEEILAGVNSTIENTVREIREKQAAKESTEQARAHIQAQRKQVQDELQQFRTAAEAVPDSQASIEKGDEVARKDNPSLTGVVLGKVDGKQVEVAFGSMRINVPLTSLVKIEAERPREHVSTQLAGGVEKNEIDVRGMYGDEAIREIDHYLYEAWSAGLKHVSIIHGKGTGALRKRVHEFLRDFPIVEEFSLGEMYEGGSGMTKVEFKTE